MALMVDIVNLSKADLYVTKVVLSARNQGVTESPEMVPLTGTYEPQRHLEPKTFVLPVRSIRAKKWPLNDHVRNPERVFVTAHSSVTTKTLDGPELARDFCQFMRMAEAPELLSELVAQLEQGGEQQEPCGEDT